MPQLNVQISDELQAKLTRVKVEVGISTAHLVRVAVEAKADELLRDVIAVPKPRKTPAQASQKPRQAPPAPIPVPKRLPDPAVVQGLIYHVVDDQHYTSAKAAASRLGIHLDALLDQLDQEDTMYLGGELCIASFGINTALAIAKQQGRDTAEFEEEVRRIEQNHQLKE